MIQVARFAHRSSVAPVVGPEDHLAGGCDAVEVAVVLTDRNKLVRYAHHPSRLYDSDEVDMTSVDSDWLDGSVDNIARPEQIAAHVRMNYDAGVRDRRFHLRFSRKPTRPRDRDVERPQLSDRVVETRLHASARYNAAVPPSPNAVRDIAVSVSARYFRDGSTEGGVRATCSDTDSDRRAFHSDRRNVEYRRETTVSRSHSVSKMNTLQELQRAIETTRAERGFTTDPVRLLCLLVEEVGEVAAEVKKTWSDNYPDPSDEDLADELADVFVVLSALASAFDVDLHDAVQSKFFDSDSRRVWATSTRQDPQVR